MLSSNIGSIYEPTCNKREQPLDCPMASHENNKREHKHTKIIIVVYPFTTAKESHTSLRLFVDG